MAGTRRLMEATLRRPRALRIPRGVAVFGVLFLSAEGVKIVRGDGLWAAIDAVMAVVLTLACLLTHRFTINGSPESVAIVRGRFIPCQLAACAIVFLATMFDAPGFAQMHAAIFDLATLVNTTYANGLTNFVTYCVPIAAVLLLLGVPLSQQGLGPFKRGSLQSAVAWLVLPVAIFCYAIASGKFGFGTILSVWFSNLLQNGVSEEFLWRGAILGRLRTVMTLENAIVIQALLFGAWHWHADMRAYHGDVMNTVADMIASQALFGLAAGYVTIRTGNIAIASAFHLLFDSLQIFQ